jgi:molybdenum cofactor synthesis domain-containing protein
MTDPSAQTSGTEPPATAAVLIIGDEILSGRTADVNLNAIAKLLVTLGVDLKEARVVADEMDDIVDAVNALRTRYTYVFTTGGIGPTHDDITADAMAQAFGVALHEHPEIIAMMVARWAGELNAARRRMARIPEGGSLIKNPVNGPPGFQIGNVFVMAGVPSIMRGMLEDVPHRLRTSAVVQSRTVRVDGSGEGVIAAPLEAVNKAHPSLSLGSYPFFSAEGFGSNLVVRGRDEAEIAAAIEELTAALRAVGVTGITLVDPA